MYNVCKVQADRWGNSIPLRYIGWRASRDQRVPLASFTMSDVFTYQSVEKAMAA